MNTITWPSRLAIGMCGATVGFYCAYSAFRNGQSLATGLDGIAFGSAFASVVVGSWFLLPLAAASPRGRRPLMRLGWALCVAFVLVNAVGFTANHRTEIVGEKTNVMTAYDVALKTLTAAQDRLSAMKANHRWSSTSGCTDATAEQSIEFCRQVQQAQSDVTTNQTVVTSGRPATADAQTDTIAWATQIDSATVARGLPIFMAVVLDIAASIFIWAALTTYDKVSIGVAELGAEVPRKAAHGKAGKAKPKKAKDWTKVESYSATPRLTKAGKVDGRTKAARAVKRVTRTRLLMPS